MFQRSILSTIFLFFLSGCRPGSDNVPTIGLIDAFEDETTSQAREGFSDALRKNGFSEESNTLRIVYRNGQGDIPILNQNVNYLIGEQVDLIGTNTTLSTVTALQRTKTIPVFMMVSPTPERMQVVNQKGQAPGNLFGVAEDLDYIDTSFSLIPKMVRPKKDMLVIGMIYNQSEPQSADALQRIKKLGDQLSVLVEALPVNTSSDAQLVTQSLLDKGIDVFFANPDNTVFAAFETILKNCNRRNVPIFTSEAGLVKRGAVAAYGADIYQWGYQSGEQAAKFLKQKSTRGLKWEMVDVRKRVFNPEAAKKFNISIPPNFDPVK